MSYSASFDFPKLRIKAFAPIQEKESLESKYWRLFPITKEEKLLGTPVYIDFNPIHGKQYLVTNATKISMYNSLDDKLMRSYSRFDDEAYSGVYRQDGKLLLAGDKLGNLKIFDIKTKSLLRSIRGHKLAVKTTAWTCDKITMLSGSDDMTVKQWDLSTEKLLWNNKTSLHTDYVRSVVASPIMPNIFASSSYDHTVKIWDNRQETVGNIFNHGYPIEYSLISPSGTLLLTAGGNEIKLWDLVSGDRTTPLHTFNNHQKNITGMCFNSTGSKLLSCGLDSFVKVYSMDSLSVIHGMKFNGPLISVAMSPDEKKLVVGYADGNLVVKNRDKKEAVDVFDYEANAAIARHYKGAGSAVIKSDDNNGLVATEHNTRLKPYEVHLKKFNYQLALDAALKTRNPLIVVTLLEELCRRDGLTIALSGRDENSLEPILSFAAKYVSNPRYARLVTQVTHTILDLYASILGQSDAIDELFLKLYKLVKNEVTFQRQAIKVLGALDSVISASCRPSSSTTAVETTTNQANEV